MKATDHSLLFLISQISSAHKTVLPDISPSHYQTLHLLTLHGPMNLSDLAEHRDVKKSSMSATMEQLASEQLILNAQSKSDARQKLYLITNKGRTLYLDMTKAGHQQIERYWPDSTSEQRQQFCDMLMALLTNPND